MAAGRRGAAGRPAAKGSSCKLIGRAHKQKICLGDDCVIERLTCRVASWSTNRWKTASPSPTPPSTNRCWLGPGCDQRGARGPAGALYLRQRQLLHRLAQNFRKVLATEIAKPSVDSRPVQHRRQRVSTTRSSCACQRRSSPWRCAARSSNPPQRGRSRRHQFYTIFVDPPRAGPRRRHQSLVPGLRQHPLHLPQPGTLQANMAVLQRETTRSPASPCSTSSPGPTTWKPGGVPETRAADQAGFPGCPMAAGAAQPLKGADPASSDRPATGQGGRPMPTILPPSPGKGQKPPD